MESETYPSRSARRFPKPRARIGQSAHRSFHGTRKPNTFGRGPRKPGFRSSPRPYTKPSSSTRTFNSSEHSFRPSAPSFSSNTQAFTPRPVARAQETSAVQRLDARDVPGIEPAVQRIKDTFISGIDDENQLPLEKEIVYEIYNCKEKALGQDALHARLYEKGLIKSSVALQEALQRLKDIGVVQYISEKFQIAKQFQR